METVTSICWKINFQILNARLREMCLITENRKPKPLFRHSAGSGQASTKRKSSRAPRGSEQNSRAWGTRAVTPYPRCLFQPNSIHAPSTVTGT